MSQSSARGTLVVQMRGGWSVVAYLGKSRRVSFQVVKCLKSLSRCYSPLITLEAGILLSKFALKISVA